MHTDFFFIQGVTIDAFPLHTGLVLAGVVAQRDEETFLSRVQPAVEALERCLSNPLLSTEDGRGAADCAACAFLKVLCFFGSRLDAKNAALQLATLLERW